MHNNVFLMNREGDIGYDSVKLAKAETEGFFIKDFPSHIATVRTQHSIWKFIVDENCNVIALATDLNGMEHPRYCKKSTTVRISGSTWGSHMIKLGYVGVGMYLELYEKGEKRGILTSMVENIKLEKML